MGSFEGWLSSWLSFKSEMPFFFWITCVSCPLWRLTAFTLLRALRDLQPPFGLVYKGSPNWLFLMAPLIHTATLPLQPESRHLLQRRSAIRLFPRRTSKWHSDLHSIRSNVFDDACASFSAISDVTSITSSHSLRTSSLDTKQRIHQCAARAATHNLM